MSAKMQVMLTLPRVCELRNIIQPVVRNKITKAGLMKRIQRDNKTLFGDLVETRKQKIAREKREKKFKTSDQSSDDLSQSKLQVDSEVHYIIDSKQRKLFRLKFKDKSVPRCETKILKIVEDKKPSEDVENFKVTPSAQSSGPISGVENSSEVKRYTSDGDDGKKLGGLPLHLFISKITSFSYLSRRKKARSNTEDKKLLSISPYSDKSKSSIPSVTRILNQTMSPESKLNLELWKQRMILQLGQEGFEKYSQELLLNGKQFHSSIQNYLIQQPLEVPPTVEKSWQSVQHVLKEVHTVKAIESHAVHSNLCYRGIVDCVAMYRGNLCVIDWKKSDKPKNSIENTFDAPIQVASYIGALNSDTNYNFQVVNGLVVVGYTNGDPASVHEINSTLLKKYWILWLRRLQQYYLNLAAADRNSIVGDKMLNDTVR